MSVVMKKSSPTILEAWLGVCCLYSNSTLSKVIYKTAALLYKPQSDTTNTSLHNHSTGGHRPVN